MTGLLDTNVALYLLGGRMASPLPAGTYGVSVITENGASCMAIAYDARRAKGSRFPRTASHL
jgi:hypothetical protein